MCEEFAIHLGTPLPSLSPCRPVPHPRHSMLFSSTSCPADLAFSFPLSLSLYIYMYLPLRSYLFLSRIRAADFSTFLPLSFSFSRLSTSPLTPAPLSLARFISARCQFEFGTRATGQRVSTKNQFLNARLFRAEGPACIFLSPPSPPPRPPIISLCHCCFDFFFNRTPCDTEMHRLAGWQNSRDQ